MSGSNHRRRRLIGANAVPTTPVDVFIFAGQSNNVVYNVGLSGLPVYIVSDAGVQIWNKAAQSFQTYSATVNSDQPGDIGPSIGAWWGPEAEFAYRYRQANPGKTCYIIKYAIASTQLYQSADGVTTTDWNPASAPSEFFGQTKTQIVNALAALRAAGKSPTVKAVLWMQGEADSLDVTQSGAYEANLAAFEIAMRSQWGDASSKLIVGRIKDIANWTNRAVVRPAQGNVVVLNPALDLFIDTDGYTNGVDNVHYNAASTSQFGQDYWFAYNAKNYITNGGFGVDLSGWAGYSYPGTGSISVPDASGIISIVAGKLRATSNGANHSFPSGRYTLSGLTVGATYKGILDHSGNVGGAPAVIRVTTSTGAVAAGSDYDSGDILAAGSKSFSFVASAATEYLYLISDSSTGYTEFDNVMVFGP